MAGPPCGHTSYPRSARPAERVAPFAPHIGTETLSSISDRISTKVDQGVTRSLNGWLYSCRDVLVFVARVICPEREGSYAGVFFAIGKQTLVPVRPGRGACPRD